MFVAAVNSILTFSNNQKYKNYQSNKVLEKIFEEFLPWRGGHLGHVTSIMSSYFHFLVPGSFQCLITEHVIRHKTH